MQVIAELFWQFNDVTRDTGSFHCSNPSFSMCLFLLPYFLLHGHKMATIALGMSFSSNCTEVGKEGEEG